MIPPEELTRIFAPLRSLLNELSVQNIRNTVAAAGWDITRITAKSEARTGTGSRAEVMPAVDALFGQMAPAHQERALRLLAEQLVAHDEEKVTRLLARHGYQFVDGSFVPVELLDAREARFLPASASATLARATARLVEGDESGAITLACGAVDLTTGKVYAKLNLGNPGGVAFAAKVNTALQKLQVFDRMKRDLRQLGMSEEDAAEAIEHLRAATNRAAQALQLLRRTMGDVHGPKPTLRRSAYDAIKYASAICGLFEGEA
jgi:SOS response regulatory protein OraA/RecX